MSMDCLAAPASLAPGIVEATANGGALADLTVTSLTSALPHSWTKQQKKFGVVWPSRVAIPK